MTEDKPIYTYAIRNEDGFYRIPHNDVIIPGFYDKDVAEKDFKLWRASDPKAPKDLEHIIIDIGPLVRDGFISISRISLSH